MEFSPFHSIPASFTLQPHPATREKQLKLWVNEFLLFYADDVCVDLTSDKTKKFFGNEIINRTASFELRRAIRMKLNIKFVNHNLWLIKNRIESSFNELMINVTGSGEWDGQFFNNVSEIINTFPSVKQKFVSPTCLMAVIKEIDPYNQRIWFQSADQNSPLVIFFISATPKESMKEMQNQILKNSPLGVIVHKSNLKNIIQAGKIITGDVNDYFINKIYGELEHDNKELKKDTTLLIRNYNDNGLLGIVKEYYSSGDRIGGVISYDELNETVGGWLTREQWEENITHNLDKFTVDKKKSKLDANHIYISRKTFSQWFDDLTSTGPVRTPLGGVYTPKELAQVFNETLKKDLKGVTAEMVLTLLEYKRQTTFLGGGKKNTDEMNTVEKDSLLKPLWQVIQEVEAKAEETLGPLQEKEEEEDMRQKLVLFTNKIRNINTHKKGQLGALSDAIVSELNSSILKKMKALALKITEEDVTPILRVKGTDEQELSLKISEEQKRLEGIVLGGEKLIAEKEAELKEKKDELPQSEMVKSRIKTLKKQLEKWRNRLNGIKSALYKLKNVESVGTLLLVGPKIDSSSGGKWQLYSIKLNRIDFTFEWNDSSKQWAPYDLRIYTPIPSEITNFYNFDSFLQALFDSPAFFLHPQNGWTSSSPEDAAGLVWSKYTFK